jgi:hypothetical protein
LAEALKVPLKGPALVGENLTVTEQFVPDATEAPQVLDTTEKPMPMVVKLGMPIALSPVLLTPMTAVEVDPDATLPKLSIVVDSVSAAGVCPVPASGMTTGKRPAPPTVKTPEREPEAAGWKRSSTAQDAMPDTTCPLQESLSFLNSAPEMLVVSGGVEACP